MTYFNPLCHQRSQWSEGFWLRESLSKPTETLTQSKEETGRALHRLHEVAKRDSHLTFNNLLHHLSIEKLTRAYYALNRKAAKGVDEQSWDDYGENLQEKVSALHTKLHTQRYQPQPTKRVWIPKASGQLRPIGITAIEDKVVQQALVWVMESIYEADFLGFSYGFRPNRNPHQALDVVYIALTEKKVSWVLDADIQGFFDHIDHGWMMKFIEHRISDKRILGLLKKILKAGVIEEGKWSKTRIGTPQGAVISPLLANIYLHYVLDLWAHQWRRKYARGEVYIVRYADDFVLGFQYRIDGEHFHQALIERLKCFGLTLHPEKTRLIEFGRFAESNRRERGAGKPETFDFLGFTHLCSNKRNNKGFSVRRQTISKRLRATVKRIKEQLKRNNMFNVHRQGRWLRKVMQGLINYYGVPGNSTALARLRTEMCCNWRKSLRRRGNKRPINWLQMTKLINRWIPKVSVVHPYPNQRRCV
ncbi:MAG: group II intron reverse transcriptase/maturase [Gammaproteobacteria bacterium]|nr:group II intron reverse transcriptase/maturase [Gammaproteobacteria bacterium]MCF6261363.1 group II intron reverse transcriptase/maturase [Gammaproteobacteria bacterium]